MTEPDLTATRLAGTPGRGDLLVMGPSLGTSVEALWSDCARLLGDRFEVVGWDLPGHGRSAAAVAPFTVADLAHAVLGFTEPLTGVRRSWYAGVSLGGAVGLQLALDTTVFTGVAVIASDTLLGEPSDWHERADLVRRAGTPVMVAGSAERWFAPGSVERHPEATARLLTSLSDADDESYALACGALASYDVGPRVSDLRVPVVLMPGEHDGVVTVDQARVTVDAAPRAELHVLTGCAHLPPAEDPAQVAAELTDFCTRSTEGAR